MTTYAYYITATYDDCEIEVKTNSADTAICALMEHAEKGAPVRVIDGFTGEIYVVANWNDDDYITEEWSMMVLGWLMKTMWEIEG
jgi:hypothetical protein